MRAGRPNWVTEDIDELCAGVAHLDNIAETRLFLSDLLTKKEINELANRWKVARMLYAKLKWTKIERLTGVSTATIASVRKRMQYGGEGYDMMFKKLTKSY